MKTKSLCLIILSFIMIISFPSICFSEMKTVEHEYCDIYLGDLNNKKELNEFRKKMKKETIEDYVFKHINTSSPWVVTTWVSDIISKYIEKVITVSHTENNRKICYKVKITYDQEVWEKYISKISVTFPALPSSWEYDVNNVLKNKSDKINIGLIIETKITNIELSQKEKLENEQEEEFYKMTQWKKNNDKYKYLDRRHLNKVLEEQKLSSSGLTDSDTVKIGKLLNLDIIVIRFIYQDSRVTKVLKVDTGEVLLFKTYKESKISQSWIEYKIDDYGNVYFYKMFGKNNVTDRKHQVWSKIVYSTQGKKIEYKLRRDEGLPIKGYDKLSHYLSLEEIDCIKQKYHTIYLYHYDIDGNTLYSSGLMDTDWRNIPPETDIDLLREKICD